MLTFSDLLAMFLVRRGAHKDDHFVMNSGLQEI